MVYVNRNLFNKVNVVWCASYAQRPRWTMEHMQQHRFVAAESQYGAEAGEE